VTQIARWFPDAIFYKPTQARVVALTIDDVPTPNDPGDRYTRLILDAIASHNRNQPAAHKPVRASFFIISSHLQPDSRSDSEPEQNILATIQAEGHELCNHGVADDFNVLQHPEVFRLQLQTTHQVLAPLSQNPIRWYRPSRGLYNPAMVQVLRQFETYEPRFALASMLPIDTFQATRDVNFSAWYLSQFSFPGAILLLHGGSPERSRHTASLLPHLLQQLQQQGYAVVTLSELWDL
ncbi:MAG: polysaccharide deacetylase family protein, partial [Cyanobacteria bacterium P01_H01_bin.121]